MGQMQRRKRQFRESMQRDGEPVPSLLVAGNRAWARRSSAIAKVLSHVITMHGIVRRARLAVSGDPGSVAHLGGEAVTMQVSPETADERARRAKASTDALIKAFDSIGITVEVVH